MSRRTAREMAVKLVYAREFHPENDYGSICAVSDERRGDAKDEAFASQLADGVREHAEEIDQVISASARDWKLQSIAWVDLCILRVAVYEMLYDNSSAHSIYINEAVELAKKYGGEKSSAFVHGVLGGVSSRDSAAEPKNDG